MAPPSGDSDNTLNLKKAVPDLEKVTATDTDREDGLDTDMPALEGDDDARQKKMAVPDPEDDYSDMPGLDDLSDDDIPVLIPSLSPLLYPSDMHALQVFKSPSDPIPSPSAFHGGKPLPTLIWMDGNFRLKRRREMASESLRMGEYYSNLDYPIAHSRPCVDWQRGEFPMRVDGENVEQGWTSELRCGWSKRHCVLHNHNVLDAPCSVPPVIQICPKENIPKKREARVIGGDVGAARTLHWFPVYWVDGWAFHAVAGTQIASNSEFCIWTATTYSLNVGNAWVVPGCTRRTADLNFVAPLILTRAALIQSEKGTGTLPSAARGFIGSHYTGSIPRELNGFCDGLWAPKTAPFHDSSALCVRDFGFAAAGSSFRPVGVSRVHLPEKISLVSNFAERRDQNLREQSSIPP
ncbi:hypothetical protein DFH06DRAFT_1140019 [Mycena polygramma]|nr:hypothetical protein DFH06DRAFT_1140019 [Mycena polygramma]